MCKIRKIKKNVKQLQKFLGFVSYYRKFILNFAKIAYPMYKLTKKNTPFYFDNNYGMAFKILKSKLTTASILTIPNWNNNFILDTDASKNAISAVLSQKENGCEKIIAYACCILNNSKVNYSVNQKELLAIIFGLKEYKSYLIGKKFTIKTDISSLKMLIKYKDLSRQLAKWIDFLSKFEFKIIYKKDCKHNNADGLFIKFNRTMIDLVKFPSEIKNNIIKAQKSDKAIKHKKILNL